MSAPAFKKIANPQNNLGMIEGLAQKICGPGLERAPFRFFVRVRGQNNYRQKALPVFGAQRFENGKAIRRRHHQIEQNQIRAKFFAELEDKLGFPIPPESVNGVRTLRELATAIDALIASKATAPV